MRRYTRLALGFSKRIENPEAAVNVHIAYSNFCWWTAKMRFTPAIAGGVTGRLWDFN